MTVFRDPRPGRSRRLDPDPVRVSRRWILPQREQTGHDAGALELFGLAFPPIADLGVGRRQMSLPARRGWQWRNASTGGAGSAR